MARAYLVKRKRSGDALLKRLEEVEGEIIQAEKDEDFQQLQTFIESADVVLDGVLGTGVKLPLKEDVRSVLGAASGILDMMEWPPLLIAVDCPSGVDTDTGEVSERRDPRGGYWSAG
jgi:NAD(P)H-hydrate epimerase